MLHKHLNTILTPPPTKLHPPKQIIHQDMQHLCNLQTVVFTQKISAPANHIHCQPTDEPTPVTTDSSPQTQLPTLTNQLLSTAHIPKFSQLVYPEWSLTHNLMNPSNVLNPKTQENLIHQQPKYAKAKYRSSAPFPASPRQFSCALIPQSQCQTHPIPCTTTHNHLDTRTTQSNTKTHSQKQTLAKPRHTVL